MDSQKLALFGGPRTIQAEFKRYNPLGNEELQAAKEVIESGVLSQFLGTWHADFYGGPKVKEFERQYKVADPETVARLVSKFYETV